MGNSRLKGSPSPGARLAWPLRGGKTRRGAHISDKSARRWPNPGQMPDAVAGLACLGCLRGMKGSASRSWRRPGMKALLGRRSVFSLLLAGALLAVVGGIAWAAIRGRAV